jgi:hypothetical protein
MPNEAHAEANFVVAMGSELNLSVVNTSRSKDGNNGSTAGDTEIAAEMSEKEAATMIATDDRDFLIHS